MPAEERFDAIVVGSGFGGSVAAYRLAEAGRRVLLLERGQPYPPGSFARSPRQMRTNFWDPQSDLFGLFDLWSFRALDVIQSSGLGGGSLIYANVMLRKDENTFVREDDEIWPITRADLEPHYDRVEAMQQPARIGGALPPKTRAMLEAGARLGLPVELPPLAVAFAADGEAPGSPLPQQPANIHGVRRSTCRMCGECDIGCNYGAKTTLDLSYLSAAHRAGAQLRSCCEVVGIAHDDDGYRIGYRQHVAARAGHPEHLLDPDPGRSGSARAPLLVLAAGTVGTTHLLLRNRAGLPGLSPALGSRASGNGDYLGFVRNCHTPGDDGALRWRYLDPSHGPVITASIHVADDVASCGRGFRIQDAGAPGFADWLWQMAEGPEDLWAARRLILKRLVRRLRGRRDTRLSLLASTLLGSSRMSAAMMPVLGMGRDIPDGRFKLEGDRLELDWGQRSSAAYFEDMRAHMRSLAEALGGEFTADPLDRLSRSITVHPVGGAPMACDWRRGVVDPSGEVHGHPGLWICDGSVMPGPVGANPSFTIAAFADRAADAMLERGA